MNPASDSPPPQPRLIRKRRRKRKPGPEATLAFEQEKPTSSRSPTLLGVLAACIVLSLTSIWFWNLRQPKDPSPNQIPPPPVAGETAAGIPLSQLPVEESMLYQTPPRKIAERFAHSTDVEERLALSRFPDHSRSLLKVYPPDAQNQPARRLKSLGYFAASGTPMEVFLAYQKDGTTRMVAVTGTREGPRVDWDAYARHSSVPWDEFFSGRSPEIIARVTVRPGEFYSRNFQDRDQWICFSLDNPDLEEGFYGYLPRHSSLADRLLSTLSQQFLRFTLTLRLDQEFPQHRQAEILRLNSPSWVLPGPGFPEAEEL